MKAPSTLVAPRPVPISIGSALSRDEAIRRLSDAVAARRYSNPGRYSRGYFRLGGMVAPRDVAITARPYVTPGVIAGYGAMTIELRGELTDTQEGSRLTGQVTAPVGRMTTASLVVASLGFAAAGVVGNGSTLPTWTFVVVGVLVLAVLWTWSIRRNQRRALRNADELTRLLSLVLAEGPPTM
jgi:hypothetical protein